MYLILCYMHKGARTREEPVHTRYAPVALGDGFLHDSSLGRLQSGPTILIRIRLLPRQWSDLLEQ